MKHIFRRGSNYFKVEQTDVYSSTTEPTVEDLHLPDAKVINSYFQGNSRSKEKWVLTTMVCGLCAITLGSIIVALNPYEYIFRQKVTLAEGSEIFEIWKKPEVDLFLKVYLFNVTNADKYESGDDEKLHFQEVGPYVYREILTHSDPHFNDNYTITSIPLHPLLYVPEMSNGTEEDILLLPNIALLSFAQVTRDASFLTRMGVNVVIRNTKNKPLVKMTSKEFMFGYKSNLVSLGNTFLPGWINFDRLGLIDRMYDVLGDTSTTFSGQIDVRKSGLIDNYNHQTTLPQWEAPCNNLTGASDGTKFPSRITEDQELLFFRKSLCRSMPLVRVGEEVVGGIHAYVYKFKNNSLDNGKINPENKCFCKHQCLPSGILDVQDCYYGFPIALSYPHFLDTDQQVLDKVAGLHPNRHDHETYFYINEEAGLPLNVSVKMQINMALGDISRIGNLKKYSNMILPMLWMDIVMPGLPQTMITKFYFYLTVGPIAQALATYLLLVGGVAFILLSLTSALLIPKMGLISSNRGGSQQQRWVPETQSLTDKLQATPTTTGANSKEMQMYYCSLLAIPSEEDS